jgi:hypothetical protein
MRSEKCLVGGNDRLACTKRSEEEFTRGRNSAHNLDDDVDRGVSGYRHRIGSDYSAFDTDWTTPGNITDSDPGNLKRKPSTGLNRGVLSVNERDERRPDRPTT